MKRTTIVAIIVIAIVVIVAGVYLGMQKGSSGGGTTPAADNPVSISNFAFAPNIITVHVGDNVTWTNNDGTPHTVTSDPNSTVTFESGHINSGSTFVLRFDQVGTFYYHCSIHTSMHGAVRVLTFG